MLETISPDARGAQTCPMKPSKLIFSKANVIANALSDAVTNNNTQRESRHDEANQMLRDTIPKVYIPQHLAKQLVNNKHA